MKNIILLIAVMVVGACATALTVPLTIKSVAGTYEVKVEEDTHRVVFLENGISESYTNGKKREAEGEAEGKWKLTKEGELHDTYSNGNIWVYTVNKDGSLTAIAQISYRVGWRRDIPKEHQFTRKRIK